MLRALRIAGVVGCLIACVAIGWLWHRSYSWSDSMWCPRPYASVFSSRGLVIISFTGNPLIDRISLPDMWQRRNGNSIEPSSAWPWDQIEKPEQPWWEERGFLGFAWLEEPPGRSWIQFPLWAPLVLSAASGIALATKLRPRFGIRTALIAMTIVALAMGVVAMRVR